MPPREPHSGLEQRERDLDGELRSAEISAGRDPGELHHEHHRYSSRAGDESETRPRGAPFFVCGILFVGCFGPDARLLRLGVVASSTPCASLSPPGTDPDLPISPVGSRGARRGRLARPSSPQRTTTPTAHGLREQ